MVSAVGSMEARDDRLLCGFDTLFARNVPHILEQIFFSLDYETYKTCLEVCKAWNELLTSEAYQGKAKSVFHDGILKDERYLH